MAQEKSLQVVRFRFLLFLHVLALGFDLLLGLIQDFLVTHGSVKVDMSLFELGARLLDIVHENGVLDEIVVRTLHRVLKLLLIFAL